MLNWSLVVMTGRIFVMTCQISQGFIFSPVIHFLILCLFFVVLYSKLELLYTSSVNLILVKFFKNTCLKFGNHYYVVFPNYITSGYYFFNDIFFLHFHKKEFYPFVWTIIEVTPEKHRGGFLFFKFILFLNIS